MIWGWIILAVRKERRKRRREAVLHSQILIVQPRIAMLSRTVVYHLAVITLLDHTQPMTLKTISQDQSLSLLSVIYQLLLVRKRPFLRQFKVSKTLMTGTSTKSQMLRKKSQQKLQSATNIQTILNQHLLSKRSLPGPLQGPLANSSTRKEALHQSESVENSTTTQVVSLPLMSAKEDKIAMT